LIVVETDGSVVIAVQCKVSPPEQWRNEPAQSNTRPARLDEEFHCRPRKPVCGDQPSNEKDPSHSPGPALFAQSSKARATLRNGQSYMTISIDTMDPCPNEPG
jgi:hypothetical protein